MIGDRIFVSKYAYGYSKYSFAPLDFLFNFKGRFMASEPKRGDVVVFKNPIDPSKWYVKRLVGMPGDTVKLKAGAVYVNKKPLKRSCKSNFAHKGYNEETVLYSNCTEYAVNKKDGYTTIHRPMLGGRYIHPNTTEDYKIPEGYYFFLGDNRDNSIDSRFPNGVGYVPRDNLVGRAEFIFWNPAVLKGDFTRLFKQF